MKNDKLASGSLLRLQKAEQEDVSEELTDQSELDQSHPNSHLEGKDRKGYNFKQNDGYRRGSCPISP